MERGNPKTKWMTSRLRGEVFVCVILKVFFLSKNRNFLWNLANYFPIKLTLRFPSQFEWRFCMSWPLTSPTVHNVDRLVLTQNFEGMLTLPGCLSPFYLAVRKASFGLTDLHFSLFLSTNWVPWFPETCCLRKRYS